MGNIQKNINIRSLTTFDVSALTKYFTEISSIEQLNEALDFAEKQKLSLLFLGGGSNILFVDDFEGLVIKINLKGTSIVKETEDYAIISAQAGENWHNFVLMCIDRGLGGIENLSLIPGNVGTSPIQNIGAYGVEIKDTLDSVEAFNIKTRKIETFDKASCNFGYRDSFFKNEGKGKYMITCVNLRLTKKNHLYNTKYGSIQEELKNKNITVPTLKDISNSVIHIRQSKLPDPSQMGNAGSFFKNPTITTEHFNELLPSFPDAPHYFLPNNKVKIPAGWLIEKSGWKGKKIEHAGVHEKQALILVNYGNATGKEIFDLSEKIIYDIKSKFNIELEREVNLIK